MIPLFRTVNKKAPTARRPSGQNQIIVHSGTINDILQLF